MTAKLKLGDYVDVEAATGHVCFAGTGKYSKAKFGIITAIGPAKRYYEVKLYGRWSNIWFEAGAVNKIDAAAYAFKILQQDNVSCK